MLFGGDYPYGVSPVTFNDMWEWDGNAWQNVQPQFSNLPPYQLIQGQPIAYNNLAYDGARDKLVVYGAWWSTATVGGFLPVTWEWDAAQGWVQANVAGPTLNGSNLFHDSYRARLVMYGNPIPTNPQFHMYEWDGTSSNWLVRLSASPLGPIAYDSRRGRFLLVDENGAMWEYSTAAPAAYDVYGRGCAGSLGIPTLTPAPSSLPWIGDTLRVQVSAVPAGAPAMMAMGFSVLRPPLDLRPFGMPGCNVYFAPEASLLLPAATTEWSLAIPNQQALRGLLFYQQAGVVDPSANAIGVALSDAAYGIVGMR
jgi:hypothetical protein